MRAKAALITFSITLMFRNRRRLWKVRAMPSRVIWCISSPASDLPSKRMSPLSGRIQPRNQVEDGRFARAVRPDQADDLARLDAERQVIDDLQAAEMLGYVVEFEQSPSVVRPPPRGADRASRSGR